MTPWETSKRTPRPWQVEALPEVLSAARAGEKVVVSAVMGSGKSVLIAEACRMLLHGLSDEYRIVVTTPSIRLVEQLTETLSEVVDVGRYYTHAKQVNQPIIVACCPSVPSLAEELRERGLKAALMFADEAHKTQSATMQAAHIALSPYSTIGLTATPFLSAEKKRLKLFDRVAYEYDAVQAMADGVIVKPILRHYTGNSGDTDEAVLEMITKTSGPGIVNAKDIADAEAYATFLNRNGVQALAIHSEMSRIEQAKAIYCLGNTEIGVRALVHVNLLTEGVDLPWLRWLAMRHPVSSRVAFCQQVGRVLRCAPGKKAAYILDPHDLFNEFSLTNEAMIGNVPEPTFEDKARDLAQELTDRSSSGEVDIEMPLVLIDRLSSYLRRLCLAFQSEGHLKRDIKSKSWRTDWPSEKQLGVLNRAKSYAVMAPAAHRSVLDAAVAAADELNKGDVSDLIDSLYTLRRLGRWPELPTLEKP